MKARQDDTNLRWEAQTESAQLIWKQYEEVIFPQIIQYALKKKYCHFKKFYHALSIKRLECEFKKNPEEDKFSIVRTTDFGALGDSGVPNVLSSTQWGTLATDFVRDRISAGDSMRCGLSFYLCYGRIEHPHGIILDKADLFFQQLITTNDFFDHMKIAARMMYDV
jgi:hypothetical protein